MVLLERKVRTEWSLIKAVLWLSFSIYKVCWNTSLFNGSISFATSVQNLWVEISFLLLTFILVWLERNIKQTSAGNQHLNLVTVQINTLLALLVSKYLSVVTHWRLKIKIPIKKATHWDYKWAEHNWRKIELNKGKTFSISIMKKNIKSNQM